MSSPDLGFSVMERVTLVILGLIVMLFFSGVMSLVGILLAWWLT